MSGLKPRRVACLVAAAMLLPCATATAVATATAAFAPATPAGACVPGPTETPVLATTDRVGIIDLHFLGAQGAPVAFFECVGTRAIALGTRAQEGDFTNFYTATFWRCGRLTRRFAATATLPDGTLARGTGSARTVSCAHRFNLGAPARVAPGRRVSVRITDRWKVGGVRAKLCTTPPGGRRGCRSVVFRDSTTATRRFRFRKRGRWTVALRLRGADVRTSVAVGVRAPRKAAALPTVLATGDSTMEGVSSFLSDDLRDSADVVSDARPGFSISDGDGWKRVARSQVARLKPAATVASIGANEGFAVRAADGAMHECCDEAWVGEFADRLRTSMLTYRRHGHARVFWLTLVAPRDARRVPIFNAVNSAILRAAATVPGVRVLRMDQLFSPNGYQETIRDGGRDVRVREPDGIHLNVAGTRIAAREIVKAMRAP